MQSKLSGMRLFLLWNTTKFVLSLFIDSCFARHHLYTFMNISFAFSFASCKSWLPIMREALSANNRTALQPIALFIPLIYNKKNNGPSTDPWETPYLTYSKSDLTPLTTIYWRLCVKWDLKKHVCMASYTVMVKFAQKNIMVDRIKRLLKINKYTNYIIFFIK